MPGPLDGIRVVELAGLGPAPFACMLLADMGADVIRVDRPGASAEARAKAAAEPLNRGRRSITVDLKQAAGIELVLRLVDDADIFVEGFRPGVTERLGLGPDACLERNARLVYGRMTGWGQSGPLAQRAGHDINYLALSGALGAMGPADGPPVPPINLVGDFGGGGMLLAFGVLCATIEARSSGQGQVVDASMVDGSATLMAMTFGRFARGEWSLERGTNLLDGGAPFYGTYACADGRYVAVGAIEPQFYEQLCAGLPVDAALLADQLERATWAERKARFAEVFLLRSRDEWAERFDGTDACLTPVLDMVEATAHPHNVARRTFVDVGGMVQPAPAPRFSRSEVLLPAPASVPGAATDAVLAELGLSVSDRERLRADGVVGPHLETDGQHQS